MWAERVASVSCLGHGQAGRGSNPSEGSAMSWGFPTFLVRGWEIPCLSWPPLQSPGVLSQHLPGFAPCLPGSAGEARNDWGLWRTGEHLMAAQTDGPEYAGESSIPLSQSPPPCCPACSHLLARLASPLHPGSHYLSAGKGHH